MLNIKEDSRWIHNQSLIVFLFHAKCEVIDNRDDGNDEDNLVKGEIVYVMENESNGKLKYWTPDEFLIVFSSLN